MRVHTLTSVLFVALLLAITGSRSLAVPLDDDFDGMADIWEVFYFGHISNCLETVDSDLDGHRNRQEFICGTDPTNSSSCFKIEISGIPGNYILDWSSVSGRVYNVLWTTDLTNSFQSLESGMDYPRNSYTDTTHAAQSTGFYCVDVDYDFPSIDQCWKLLEVRNPTSEALTNWFATWLAAGFVDRGETATEVRDDWIEGGIPEGVTFSVEVIEPMDVSGTSYITGQWSRIHYSWATESGFFLSSMVYNGTNWLWYGDQRWVGIEFRPHAEMHVSSSGSTSYDSGFCISLWDDSLYAYNQGCLSAIITGPGLPLDGVILEHYYPDESILKLYPKGSPTGGWFYGLDDTTISSIPNDAEYTISLYAESAATVSLDDTPLKTYTRTLIKRPLLNSELNASLFPTLLIPNSHDESTMNIPGVTEISWANPTNMVADFLNLGLYLPGGSYNTMIMPEFEPGETSIYVDTSDQPAGIRANQLYLHGQDSYNRQFAFSWAFHFF